MSKLSKLLDAPEIRFVRILWCDNDTITPPLGELGLPVESIDITILIPASSSDEVSPFRGTL